jgi:hypothetical protein
MKAGKEERRNRSRVEEGIGWDAGKEERKGEAGRET